MTASAAISSMHMIDATADAVHSSPARSTGYKNATPSGSLSLKPSVGGFVIGKDLEMVDVADLGAGVDLDRDCHWSLLSLRFPQCALLRFGSSSTGLFRLIALILGANSCHNIAMLHWISMFAAGAMVALSIFFVFRPHHPLNGIQPPHQTLAGTGCVAPPETNAMPPEYSCEKPYNLARKVLFRPRH